MRRTIIGGALVAAAASLSVVGAGTAMASPAPSPAVTQAGHINSPDDPADQGGQDGDESGSQDPADQGGQDGDESGSQDPADQGGDGPAGLDNSDKSVSGQVEVDVDDIITLTISSDDKDALLKGNPEVDGVDQPDNTISYNVKTNSANGYQVSIKSDSDNLVSEDSDDVIPFADITAQNDDTEAVNGADDAHSTIPGSGDTVDELSTDDGLLYSKDGRTGIDGDDLTTNFDVDIPWVDSVDYTGTVTFTAVVK